MMKKILFCITAVVSFTFAANDELLETLADETLHNLLYCNAQVGMIDENCKKTGSFVVWTRKKLSALDQKKLQDLVMPKFIEMEEKARKQK